MTNEEAKALLEKYSAGNCTEEEKALLHAWYLTYAADNSVSLSGQEIEAAVKEIWETLPMQEQRKRGIPIRYMVRAAAAVVIFAAAGLYFFMPKSSHSPRPQPTYASDIAPGGNKAVLTLADGSMINLSDARIGNLDKTGLVRIVKAKDGQIAYDKPGQQAAATQIGYNLV